MKNKRIYKYYAADFETTTSSDKEVSVWSAHMIKIGTDVKPIHENCLHDTNIDDFVNRIYHLCKTSGHICIYFHNLKFDGSYILDYLDRAEWKLYSNEENGCTVLKDRKDSDKGMSDHEYTYVISTMNVIYSITLKCGRNYLQIRDSMKLLPFSLAKIAKDFELPHKKLEMEYSGKSVGYIPTKEEMAYIDNDVFVLKEAIEKFCVLTGRTLDEGIPLTIGSECMREYKELFKLSHIDRYKDYYPSQIDDKTGAADGYITYDEYVRRSYKGGWCYVSRKTKGKVLSRGGYVYDVNSLYPSVMHSQSGSFYPWGHGYYYTGDLTETEQRFYKEHKLWYVMHIKTRFKLKPGYLPTVQIKGDYRYDSTAWLETSDIYDGRTQANIPTSVDLYLTCTDVELLKEHYILTDYNVISRICYCAETGVFDDYINKWYEIKQNSKGSKRTLAKLFLNNLYGKFGQSADSSYIIMSRNKETGALRGESVEYIDETRASYVPVAAAVTSWARNFTIRHAQKNYKNFCYADTDSLHMLGTYNEAVDIIEHPTALCAWKCESTWDRAIFAGQKRYIEHIIEEDHVSCEEYDNIKCCGLGRGAKEYLAGMLKSGRYAAYGKVKEDFGYSDFKSGLVVPGNLRGERVKGGICLIEQAFVFR